VSRTCKACRCDRADWLDQQIKGGKADTWISSRLRSMGVSIAPSSISRHRRVCLGVERAPSKSKAPKLSVVKTDTDDCIATPVVIDTSDILREMRETNEPATHIYSKMLRDVAFEQ
jgi:hypothetical protein